jgi:acyl-CoA synthetase (AMP-forming)/AMP-acid ligase II
MRCPRPPGAARFRALDGTERFFQWRALVREARRRGALLRAAGLCKDDRLAIVIAEPHAFVLTLLGAVVAGIRAVIERPIERVPGLQWLLTVEQVFRDGAAPAEPVSWPRIEPQDLCFLQFTSGSTSMPKGMMVSHRNLIANADAFLGPHGAARRDDDVTVTWLPLFHDARRPTIWMQAMHDLRGTITFAPNFAYAWPSSARALVKQGEEALVIAAEGNSTDSAQLRKAIADRVNAAFGLTASHVAVVRVGSLPKTSSGKVQRRKTKQLFEQDLLEEHTGAERANPT